MRTNFLPGEPELAAPADSAEENPKDIDPSRRWPAPMADAGMLGRSAAAKAALPSLLFVVVTSRATRRRALAAYESWCTDAAAAASWCRFMADKPFGGEDGASPPRPAGLHWTVVRGATAPPAGACCRNGRGFFCSAHRKQTLAAQYRFLPALALARRAAPFTSGRAQWVVLVDDDSFVFVRRLRRLLARYSPDQPLMLGEFRADHRYACGGAGAVLSRAALRSLDLEGCIARTRRRCLQSDWQLGECVRRARPAVRLEARHGCGTCATPARNCSGASGESGRADGRAAALRGASTAEACAEPPPAGCHFMQDAAPHVDWLLATANCSRVRAPSIVHGGAGGRTIAAALAAARPGACHRMASLAT